MNQEVGKKAFIFRNFIDRNYFKRPSYTLGKRRKKFIKITILE